MTCYHPIPAAQADDWIPTPQGPWIHEKTVDLWPHVGYANMELPCGNCIGCKTDKATTWARRASHEASLWAHNCFLTVTYDDEHLPVDGNLHHEHIQKFLKRLRRAISRSTPAIDSRRDRSLRYMVAGEYGSQADRPHYHLLLFNCRFNDLYQVGKGLYESRIMTQLWPAGTHKLGELTPASANYVAQYTIKKIGSTYCDPDGVVRPKPYMRQSLKPAIGDEWINKNKNDAKHGYLVNDGRKGPLPRRYKTYLKRLDPQFADQVVQRAALAARAPPTGAEKQRQLQAMEAMHYRRNELKKFNNK